MYATVYSVDVRGGTTEHMLCISYNGCTQKVPNVPYFLNTLWLIPRSTRQPWNHWARTTGRTPLGWTSTAFLGLYIDSYPSSFFTSSKHPQAARVFLECFQSVWVCFVSMCVRRLRVSKCSWGETLEILFQGGNVRSLAFNYVVMLLFLCLVMVASLVML
jgi:hypothetical protein